MEEPILKQLIGRPIGLTAFVLLVILYLGAIFAPALAPNPMASQNLSKPFHPPTLLRWSAQDGFFIYRTQHDLDNPGFFKHTGDKVSVHLISKGEPYKLLGLFPANLHLFQLGSNALPSDAFYLLGADGTGRDTFARLLHGSRISLSIGFVGISITMLLGFIIGGLSGYFGGSIDFWSMRLVEMLMAIPGLYLLLALRSALAPYFKPDKMYLVIIIILSLIGWAGTARIIRGLSLSLSQRQYVLAAVAMGQSTPTILLKHILPNLASYLLVAATLSIPSYILGEAALSFLGLGIQEPGASWGLMLKQGQSMTVFMMNYWWLLSPGLLIFITVMSFNLLGDTLRDIVDPKMKV